MIYIFLLTGLGNLVVSQPDVVRTTPMEDQPVAANFDGNITYSCSVEGGAAAVWSVNGAQIHSSQQMQSFIADGYDFDPPNTDSASSTLIITAAAWYNNSITVQCLAIANLIERLGDGIIYHVTYYDIPDEVGDLELLSSLKLLWSRPANLNVPILSQVPISYTIEINATDGSGMNFRNFTNETSFSVQFLEDILRDLGSECVEFQFFVFASDDAGSGPLARVLDTVPISPDVQNVSRDLRVERVDLQQQRVNISFPPVKPCSENFALTNYTVNIDGYVYRNVTPQEVSNGAPLSLYDLPPDRSFSLTIRACNNVTCRTSNSTTVNTTDVQAVQAVFYGSRLFLQCSFADNSRARGCVFEFSLIGSNDTSRFNVSREEGFMCNSTRFPRDAYSSVFVMDWEENGMAGNLPLNITSVVRNVSLEEYMELNDCPVEEESVQANVGAVVGGSVGGIVFATCIVAVVVPLIVFLVMRGRTMVTINKKLKMVEIDISPTKDMILDLSSKEDGELQEAKPDQPVQPIELMQPAVEETLEPLEQESQPSGSPPLDHRVEEYSGDQKLSSAQRPEVSSEGIEPTILEGTSGPVSGAELWPAIAIDIEGGASGSQPPPPLGSRVEDKSGDVFEDKKKLQKGVVSEPPSQPVAVDVSKSGIIELEPESNVKHTSVRGVATDSSTIIEMEAVKGIVSEPPSQPVAVDVSKLDIIEMEPESNVKLTTSVRGVATDSSAIIEIEAVRESAMASGPPPPPENVENEAITEDEESPLLQKLPLLSDSIPKQEGISAPVSGAELLVAPIDIDMECGVSGPSSSKLGSRIVSDSGELQENKEEGVASLSLYTHDIDEEMSEDENAPLLQKSHTKKPSKPESKLSKLKKKYNDLEKEKSRHESKVLKLETDLTELDNTCKDLKKHLEKAEREKKEMDERVRLEYGDSGGGPLILKIRWQPLVDSLRARYPRGTTSKDTFSKFKVQLEF